MTIRRLVVAVVAVAALALSPSASVGATYRVKAVGDSPASFAWQPMERHAPKGSKIVWKNTSSAAHRVTAYGRKWNYNKALPRDGRVSKRFRKTGAYKYRCTVPGHSSLQDGRCQGMCGVIRIHR